ncbi:unnamed protein product [Larinioides sclopetarius]|uniref:Sodium-dependent multivitamin transporter n=1 Tax=Larinioides sclopetarius TaxID=280406 RepID=A0AAV1Z4S8_9ARAC
MPYGIIYIFGKIPGITGLCIAGVFSASLGTLSSAVNALANITVEDFIKPFCCFKNISDTWMTFIAKLLAVGYTGLILLMALVASSFGSILEAATIVYCMITAPILGIYLLGMFTTTANEKGTLIGLLMGVALYAWAGFGNNITKPAITTLPRSTAGCHTNSSVDLLSVSTEASVTESVTEILNFTRDEESSDIFEVYKLSYMWLPLFSVAVTLVVGYITSFLLKLCIQVPEVKPETISPFVRKFYFKSLKKTDEPKSKEKKVSCILQIFYQFVLSKKNSSWKAGKER